MILASQLSKVVWSAGWRSFGEMAKCEEGEGDGEMGGGGRGMGAGLESEGSLRKASER